MPGVIGGTWLDEEEPGYGKQDSLGGRAEGKRQAISAAAVLLCSCESCEAAVQPQTAALSSWCLLCVVGMVRDASSQVGPGSSHFCKALDHSLLGQPGLSVTWDLVSKAESTYGFRAEGQRAPVLLLLSVRQLPALHSWLCLKG